MASWSVREYSLTIAEEPVHIDGKTANGVTINGKIPGPTLFFLITINPQLCEKNTRVLTL